MSEGDEVQVPPAAAAATAASGPLDVEGALKIVLRAAGFVDGVARGLHEAAKALDKLLFFNFPTHFRREAHFAVLAENCDEKKYVTLVESLCSEHQIPLIKVSDKKVLGEWVGQCKYDKEGKARKVVGCSCAVVRDYGNEDQARQVLQHYFDSKKQ